MNGSGHVAGVMGTIQPLIADQIFYQRADRRSIDTIMTQNHSSKTLEPALIFAHTNSKAIL